MHCIFSNLLSVVYVQRYSLLEILIYLLHYMNTYMCKVPIRTCTRYQSRQVYVHVKDTQTYLTLDSPHVLYSSIRHGDIHPLLERKEVVLCYILGCLASTLTDQSILRAHILCRYH